MKELFRLADPDHSGSIDREEFKGFLSELRIPETASDIFPLALESRKIRAIESEEKARQSKMLDAGLLVHKRGVRHPVADAQPHRRRLPQQAGSSVVWWWRFGIIRVRKIGELALFFSSALSVLCSIYFFVTMGQDKA